MLLPAIEPRLLGHPARSVGSQCFRHATLHDPDVNAELAPHRRNLKTSLRVRGFILRARRIGPTVRVQQEAFVGEVRNLFTRGWYPPSTEPAHLSVGKPSVMVKCRSFTYMSACVVKSKWTFTSSCPKRRFMATATPRTVHVRKVNGSVNCVTFYCLIERLSSS